MKMGFSGRLSDIEIFTLLTYSDVLLSALETFWGRSRILLSPLARKDPTIRDPSPDPPKLPHG